MIDRHYRNIPYSGINFNRGKDVVVAKGMAV